MYPSLPSPPSTPNRGKPSSGTSAPRRSKAFDPEALGLKEDDPWPGLSKQSQFRSSYPSPRSTPAKQPRPSGGRASSNATPKRAQTKTSPADATDTASTPKASPLRGTKTAEDLFNRPINATAMDVDEDIYDSPHAVIDGFKPHVRLHPHQVLSRQWMREREDPSKGAFGGILADDMGLGKTIQVLTLVVDSLKEERTTGPTLVVCPSEVMMNQWEDECNKVTEGVTHFRFHGPKRYDNPRKMLGSNIVFTTYHIVRRVHDREKVEQNDTLFRTHWSRIVLDEAHGIRNHDRMTSEAACALKATYRWCLSGTPLQNSVMDLYSLFKFLQIPKFSDLEFFKSHIAKPLGFGTKAQWAALSAEEAMKLLQDGVVPITLRRTKDQEFNGRKLIELPAKSIRTISCRLDDHHREFYAALDVRAQGMARFFARDEEERQHLSMRYLVLLLRLKQACNHPSLIFREDVPINKENARCKVCSVGLGEDEDRYCEACQPLVAQAKQFGLHSRDMRTGKVREMVQILKGVLSAAEKTIIYSQWTSMLNIVEAVMHEERVKCVRYDGSMNVRQRALSLKAIAEDPATKVILISLKAGGEGLNLTSCNNVIFLDPWWNPAVEHQAFDRAHRIGQNKTVNIYKLVTDDTVEGRILALQERKEKLAHAVLHGAKKKAGAGLTTEEMRKILIPSARTGRPGRTSA